MTKNALFTLTLLGLLTGCGSQTGTTDKKQCSLDNPCLTVTPTVQPTVSSDYNLAPFAKLEASSTDSDNYAPDFAVDGFIPKAGNVATLLWLPNKAVINSSFLKLSWNSQVQITSIELYDNPDAGQQITKGKIEFDNTKDSSLAIPKADFAELPDAATNLKSSALILSGPSSPVTSMTIYIQNHKGEGAGLSEVIVNGHRIEENIDEAEISSHMRISSVSSIFGELAGFEGFNTGGYRPRKMCDGNEASQWSSNGNGPSAEASFEFDRAYSLKAITLVDRPAAANAYFTGGDIEFTDIGKKVSFTKAATDSKVLVVIPEGIQSKAFTVKLTSVGGGTANTGLSEVKVTGSYTAAQ